MAQYFHHNIIKKYTLGLLDTFNDIQVERTLSNGSNSYITVPITFGSKDKAFVLSEMDIEQWKTNNYNVLPRMALSLITINKDQKRDTHKLHTINKTINNDKVTFQYNATAWNLTYELAIACRGMTELAMILEQILPRFNPTYNLTIKELDIQDEPSTVPVSLMSVDVDLPSNIGQDDDIRIVGAMVMLEVRGNIYQPFTDSDIIKNVRLYLNTWDAPNTINEEKRSIKYEFDTINGVPSNETRVDFENSGTVAKNAPVVSGILGSDTVVVGSVNNYTLVFSDVDDEQGFTYIWNIVSGSEFATISNNTSNPCILTASAIGLVTIMGQVIDRDNNISNFLTKSITIT